VSKLLILFVLGGHKLLKFIFHIIGVVQISVGEYHAACCTARGEVYVWGTQSNGMSLGTGRSGVIAKPQLVSGFDGEYIVKVVCGSESTYALSTDGHVFSWGVGRHGVLGHGDECKFLFLFYSYFYDSN
jgi:alpha-tubulin suppressor-like RCC1 family protein